MKRSGWYGESYRHYLSSKGVSTKKYYSPVSERQWQELNAKAAEARKALEEYKAKGGEVKTATPGTYIRSRAAPRTLDTREALILAMRIKEESPELNFMSQRELAEEILSGRLKLNRPSGAPNELQHAISKAVIERRMYEKLAAQQQPLADLVSKTSHVSAKDVQRPNSPVRPEVKELQDAPGLSTKEKKRLQAALKEMGMQTTDIEAEVVPGYTKAGDISFKKTLNKTAHKLRSIPGWKPNPKYVQQRGYPAPARSDEEEDE